jgi:hypothetical protein
LTDRLAHVRTDCDAMLGRLLLLWQRVDPGDPRVRLDGAAVDVLRLALAP